MNSKRVACAVYTTYAHCRQTVVRRKVLALMLSIDLLLSVYSGDQRNLRGFGINSQNACIASFAGLDDRIRILWTASEVVKPAYPARCLYRCLVHIHHMVVIPLPSRILGNRSPAVTKISILRPGLLQFPVQLAVPRLLSPVRKYRMRRVPMFVRIDPVYVIDG